MNVIHHGPQKKPVVPSAPNLRQNRNEKSPIPNPKAVQISCGASLQPQAYNAMRFVKRNERNRE